MDAAYDAVAEIYNATLDPGGVGMSDPVFDELVGDVRGQRVLALACGQGRDARTLADRGAIVTGVDISERLLEYARRFERDRPRNIRYEHADAQRLEGLPSDEFDGAVCHMALMDIPELRPTVAAVARVLRPGGWFVFSIVHPCFSAHVEAVPDYLASTRYDKVGGWQVLPPHAYHRPLSTYVNELAAVGLPITTMREPADDPETGNVPGLLYARCQG